MWVYIYISLSLSLSLKAQELEATLLLRSFSSHRAWVHSAPALLQVCVGYVTKSLATASAQCHPLGRCDHACLQVLPHALSQCTIGTQTPGWDQWKGAEKAEVAQPDWNHGISAKGHGYRVGWCRLPNCSCSERTPSNPGRAGSAASDAGRKRNPWHLGRVRLENGGMAWPSWLLRSPRSTEGWRESGGWRLHPVGLWWPSSHHSLLDRKAPAPENWPLRRSSMRHLEEG